MPKTRKNYSERKRNEIIKTIRQTTSSALPVVNTGLKQIGTVSKNVATASIPILEKGVSAVYGTMAKGLDLGIKGVKSVARGVKKISRKRQVTRGRSRKGGKSRRH
jgi:hypothetical protein